MGFTDTLTQLQSLRPRAPAVGHGRKGAPIFRNGELLAGTYEVCSLLGSGGMGQVFDAVDHSLGRRVAIKAAWPEMRQPRLRAEARALAAFRHRSLPTVYSLQSHGGIDFIVMERVYGVTLTDHAERALSAGEALSVEEVTELLGSIAKALAVIHDAGLAHLDVKPDNIMLAPDRGVVMLDFGLALPEYGLVGQARAAGTPEYMAPEIVTGGLQLGGGQLADLYSLGVTAYALLTGRLPREVDSLRDLVNLSDDVPLDVADKRHDLPRELANLVNSMMALDPERRPQSADAVAWQLRAYRERRSGKVTLKMLVVEDDIHVSKVLGFYAKKALPRLAIRSANNGVVALEVLKSWSPDVMLLDLNMPKRSGVELCMYMRGAGLAEDCTIVMVSAAANDADRRLLRTLGIRHFVTKDEKLRAQLVQVLQSLFGDPRHPVDRS